MGSEHFPVRRSNGGRFQSGIPKRVAPNQPLRARGLFLRGVVIATYVIDDTEHPRADKTIRGQQVKSLKTGAKPVAVYCDVITYGSRAGMQTRLIPSCLVLQRRGGLHDGDIWLPKATTIDVNGSALDRNTGSDSATWDGDHVLVGFIDDDFGQPIIVGGVPHPSADAGVEAQGDTAAERRRLKLRQVDGHPDFTKHHGSYYGINNDGDHVVDTRFANDGSISTTGVEPDAPTDGKGAQTAQLPKDATYQLTLEDMANPASPAVKVTLEITKEKLRFVFADSSFEFLVDDAASEIHLGGSGEDASVDAKLQTELSRLKADIDNLKWELGRHRHPLPEFPMPLLFGDILQCFQQPLLYVTKSQAPINLRTSNNASPDSALMDADAGTSEFFGVPTGPTVADVLSEGSDPGTTKSDTVKLKS